MQYVWVGIGGALGSILRIFLQTWVQSTSATLFPIGTLAVNLMGSAVVGFLGGVFESVPVSPQLKVFLVVGVLGGFTTFSAFSLGNLTLIRSGQGRTAILYILTSNALGIGLAFGGYFLARFVIRSFSLGSAIG
jgi:fluoride exporter